MVSLKTIPRRTIERFSTLCSRISLDLNFTFFTGKQKLYNGPNYSRCNMLQPIKKNIPIYHACTIKNNSHKDKLPIV